MLGLLNWLSRLQELFLKSRISCVSRMSEAQTLRTGGNIWFCYLIISSISKHCGRKVNYLPFADGERHRWSETHIVQCDYSYTCVVLRIWLIGYRIARDVKKVVPTIVPADSHSKPLQNLYHRSSWMILHNFEPKKSTNGPVFVSVALVKAVQWDFSMRTEISMKFPFG